jgi:hypothetical protein
VNVRAICEGHFTLPLPVEATLPLFTPEGERAWAGPSWDPVYPVPDAATGDAAPGTVFTTDSDGGEAVWIVIDRQSDALRYARVAPDRIAGTVAVTCAQEEEGTTRVTVTYDVTSLGPEGTSFVNELKTNFDTFLAHWREHILGTSP